MPLVPQRQRARRDHRSGAGRRRGAAGPVGAGAAGSACEAPARPVHPDCFDSCTAQNNANAAVLAVSLYIYHGPVARGGKQSNEGLGLPAGLGGGVCWSVCEGWGGDAGSGRFLAPPPSPRPRSLSYSSFVLYSVRAPRQSRLGSCSCPSEASVKNLKIDGKLSRKWARGGRCLKNADREGVGVTRWPARAAGAGSEGRGHGPPIIGPGGRLPAPPRPRLLRGLRPWGRPPGTTPCTRGLTWHPARGGSQADSGAPGPATRTAVAGRGGPPARPPPPHPRPMRGRGPLVPPAVARGAASAPCGPTEARGGKGHPPPAGENHPPPSGSARGDWSPARLGVPAAARTHRGSTHGSLFPERRKHVRI